MTIFVAYYVTIASSIITTIAIIEFKSAGKVWNLLFCETKSTSYFSRKFLVFARDYGQLHIFVALTTSLGLRKVYPELDSGLKTADFSGSTAAMDV